MSKESTAKKGADPEEQGIRMHARWVEGEGLEPLTAQHLHLSKVESQYYLTFGQLRPPVLDFENDADPIIAEIRPVVQLVVPEEALGRIGDLIMRYLSTASGKDSGSK